MFQDALIESVLNYLSESLDFIVVKQGHIDGRITVNARGPVTGEEAVDALNTILKTQNLTIQQNGRLLNVVSLEKGRQSAPVFNGSDPQTIPISDSIRTQVMPVGDGRCDEAEKRSSAPAVAGRQPVTANQGRQRDHHHGHVGEYSPGGGNHLRPRHAQGIGHRHPHLHTPCNANATATAKLINDVFKQDATPTAQQGGGLFGGGGFRGNFFGPPGGGGGGGGRFGGARRRGWWRRRRGVAAKRQSERGLRRAQRQNQCLGR